jgi:transcriptional regulator with XRE-family HTH domain
VTDGSTATEHDHTRIGPRLRAIRRQQGLTLADVAAATELSKGFVSLLERNGAAPSVATLLKICHFLGVRVGSLFQEDAGTSLIRRAEQKQEALFGGFGIADSILTPADQGDLEVIESDIEPGGNSGIELHRFNADTEVVYVMRGMLDVVIGNDRYRLRAGDTLTLSPREPHAWVNPSKTRRASVLWIITPRSL